MSYSTDIQTSSKDIIQIYDIFLLRRAVGKKKLIVERIVAGKAFTRKIFSVFRRIKIPLRIYMSVEYCDLLGHCIGGSELLKYGFKHCFRVRTRLNLQRKRYTDQSQAIVSWSC